MLLSSVTTTLAAAARRAGRTGRAVHAAASAGALRANAIAFVPLGAPAGVFDPSTIPAIILRYVFGPVLAVYGVGLLVAHKKKKFGEMFGELMMISIGAAFLIAPNDVIGFITDLVHQTGLKT